MISIRINIELFDGDTLDKALAEFGFVRSFRPAWSPPAAQDATGNQSDDGPSLREKIADEQEMTTEQALAHQRVEDSLREDNNKAKTEGLLTEMDGDRKRGEPKPGGRRRTNAQIAEDERYFEQKTRAEAALAKMEQGVHPEPGSVEHEDVVRKRQDEFMADQNGSQDAADEAAETAARPAGEPTMEDLRAAVTRYIDKFSQVNWIKNGRAIIGRAVHEYEKHLGEIPTAIKAIEKAIAEHGVADTPAETSLFDEKPAEPTATQADLIDAMKAYGKRYDGSDDTNNMPLTKQDLPKVFAEVFGSHVTGLGSMPDRTPENFGKIVAAIQRATAENVFRREVKP